jgi:hypothetical protein
MATSRRQKGGAPWARCSAMGRGAMRQKPATGISLKIGLNMRHDALASSR